jgi:uncharacterized protein (DUF1684 family)
MAVPAAGLLPIDPDYNAPGAPADRRQDDLRDAHVDRREPQDAARRLAGFTLEAPMKLLAFNEIGTNPGSLFVAFSDLTNGTETYAAGRFMDLVRNRTGIYEVDFNRAYIPYCYYNPTYECPLPPTENRLKIPIRAGEKMKLEVRSEK